MNDKNIREKAILYLYGEMSREEKLLFEQELSGSAELRDVYEKEKELHKLYDLSGKEDIPDSVMTESRSRLRESLREEDNKVRFVKPGFVERYIRTLMPKAAVALTIFIFGILIGKFVLIELTSDGDIEILQMVSADNNAISADMFGSNDMEITDLRIIEYDRKSGEITLLLDAVSSVGIKGSINNRKVQKILAAALQSDLGPSVRLKSVDLLQRQTDDKEIIKALIYALRHDDNPGVRLKAAQALSLSTNNLDAKKALIEALTNDINTGVRIQAIVALKDFRDADVMEIFKKKMESDENEYIRKQSEESLSNWEIIKTEREI